MLFVNLFLSLSLFGLNYLTSVSAFPGLNVEYDSTNFSPTFSPESAPTNLATLVVNGGQPSHPTGVPHPERITSFPAGLSTQSGELPALPTFDGPASIYTNMGRQVEPRQVGAADGTPFPFHPQRTSAFSPGIFETMQIATTFQGIYCGAPTAAVKREAVPDVRRATADKSTLTGYVEIATFDDCPALNSAYSYACALMPPEEGCYSVGWANEFLFHGVCGLIKVGE